MPNQLPTLLDVPRCIFTPAHPVLRWRESQGLTTRQNHTVPPVAADKITEFLTAYLSLDLSSEDDLPEFPPAESDYPDFSGSEGLTNPDISPDPLLELMRQGIAEAEAEIARREAAEAGPQQRRPNRSEAITLLSLAAFATALPATAALERLYWPGTVTVLQVPPGYRLPAPWASGIREFIAEFHREMEKERRESAAGRVEAERALVKITSEIENILTAITEGMFHPSMKAKMDALEAQKAGLEAKLAALPAPSPVILHPGIADVYAAKVSKLTEALNDPESLPEAVAILRGLIERIVMIPQPGQPGGHLIELHGELRSILSLCDGGLEAPVPGKQKARSGATGVGQLTMVAGAGFEPAAFRL